MHNSFNTNISTLVWKVKFDINFDGLEWYIGRMYIREKFFVQMSEI